MKISRRRFSRLLGGAAGAVALGSLTGGCFEDSALGESDSGADADLQDSAPGEPCSGDDAELLRPNGWTAATHCSETDPNYSLLFTDDVVHRFDIEVSPSNYELTMENLSEIASSAGGGMGGDLMTDVEDPIWVPVTVRFDGVTWWKVGMRYKGNSSLIGAWNSGVRKLAFRLTFDKYEDENPDLENQRFYGFKKLTFANAFNDPSLIRDKVAADIFRDGGVPAARGAFARVYVDHGEGPVYFGLYTMIEDPSDTMIESDQFSGDGSGNLYKPEGTGADWTSFDEEGFPKKTNESDEDFSDVIAAIDALHADPSDAAAWREELEAVFDVQGFLRYLALNQTMVNWDSYGCMAHNYYLYGVPDDGGRLTWFPWDLNESLISTRRACSTADSVLLYDITDEWPLIRYLLDDEVYAGVYLDELLAALDGAFTEAPLLARMQAYHDLIAPFVIGDDGESGVYTHLLSAQSFEDSIDGADGLAAHVAARRAAVTAALED